MLYDALSTLFQGNSSDVIIYLNVSRKLYTKIQVWNIGDYKEGGLSKLTHFN